MELERHRQSSTEPLFSVLAPDKEGVVVAAGIDIHRAVDLIPRQSRGADHHIVLARFIALPALVDLSGEFQVILIELLQVGRNGNVTGGDAAVPGVREVLLGSTSFMLFSILFVKSGSVGRGK